MHIVFDYIQYVRVEENLLGLMPKDGDIVDETTYMWHHKLKCARARISARNLPLIKTASYNLQREI
jgi:hypothetical protein